MEHRLLGACGLRVPVLSFGTATFGGSTDFFHAWGNSSVDEAKRLMSICLETGVNLFDTADAYSNGLAEEILGQALQGRRHQALISTKVAFRVGEGPNDVGASRHHLLRSCEASLRRLKTDHIDIYHLHRYDALTPLEETLSTLDGLVQSGKVRYLACSNFSGWQLMKSLAVSQRHAWSHYVAHQVYYSLIGREYEWELMPLALDQNVAGVVWSPLGYGRLTGRIRRNQPLPPHSRLHHVTDRGPPVHEELLYNVVGVLDEVAHETGKAISQVALNWLLHRPTVASVIIGARDEAQLRENLGAAGWRLSDEHMAKLDAVSQQVSCYPYWHQRLSPERNPLPVPAR